MKRRTRFASLGLALLSALVPGASAVSAQAPPEPVGGLTVEHPIAVDLAPETSPVPPGGRSQLILRIAVPEGFWIGAAEDHVRAPGPTRLVVGPSECFVFGSPRWPEPEVAGIPVGLGTTRIYRGEVTVPIPFEVDPGCPDGSHPVSVALTYTPGLDAGHLSPHVAERHEAEVEVAAGAPGAVPQAGPAVAPAPGLRIEPVDPRLPAPLEPMRFDVSPRSPVARILHRVWEDPPNHGKSVQGVVYPLASSGANTGTSVGMGVGLVNATREGIGTGAVNLRAQHNEWVGDLLSLDVLSCPGAYHNFWLTAYAAEDDTTHGLTFRLENLTRNQGTWGYRVTLDAFEDGRFRYFGQGADAQEEAETAYSHRQLGGTVDLWWNAATNWRLGAGVRVADVKVRDAADDLLAERRSIFDVFPDAPGIDGGRVVAPRVQVELDHRNQEFTPSRGTLVRALVERVELDGDGQTANDLESSWDRWEVEARQYWSTAGQRATVVLRSRLTEVGHASIPFWELPSLGGDDSLRAYGDGRFRGKGSLFASAELRVQALHLVAMGMPLDVEIAPFVDLGRVYDGDLFGADFFDAGFNADPGLSLRVLNRPNVGLIVSWARGRDGDQVTGGVSLPF